MDDLSALVFFNIVIDLFCNEDCKTNSLTLISLFDEYF